MQEREVAKPNKAKSRNPHTVAGLSRLSVTDNKAKAKNEELCSTLYTLGLKKLHKINTHSVCILTTAELAETYSRRELVCVVGNGVKGF